MAYSAEIKPEPRRTAKVRHSPSPSWPSIQASIATYPYLPVLLAFDLGYLLLWATMINEIFVRQAA